MCVRACMHAPRIRPPHVWSCSANRLVNTSRVYDVVRQKRQSERVRARTFVLSYLWCACTHQGLLLAHLELQHQFSFQHLARSVRQCVQMAYSVRTCMPVCARVRLKTSLYVCMHLPMHMCSRAQQGEQASRQARACVRAHCLRRHRVIELWRRPSPVFAR